MFSHGIEATSFLKIFKILILDEEEDETFSQNQLQLEVSSI